MIKHVVAFRFRADVDESRRNAMLDELQTFPRKYPAMRNWTLGLNTSNRDTSMSHAFTVEFDTREELDKYLTSDTHETFVREVWRPLIDARTIVSLETHDSDRSSSMTSPVQTR